MSSEDNPTQAVILAAGVGRRLGTTHQGPKALLPFAGRSLIRRHLDALRASGIDTVTIVMGHQASSLRAHLAESGGGVADFLFNPDFTEGSMVSLACAADVLRSGHNLLLMDADVLYEADVLHRLVTTRHPDCFLVDREIEPGDEPVKLCIRDGRIVDFAKRPDNAYEWHGESVGFFRFAPATAAELAARAEAAVAAGARDAEYEAAIRDMIRASAADRFGFEDITGLAWTEIDFPDDVVRARSMIDRIDTGQAGRDQARWGVAR